MNVLDLFSGIGGFSLGLERAGMRTVAFCEIDPFCRRVLRKHWPTIPIFGDIRQLTRSALAGNSGTRTIDVICGGFPCQDISVAGKGIGIEGDRSGLWSEYRRLIGELRPRYAIVENVAALLNRGLDRVLGDLATLGYDAEWHCIPASAIGAPHRRDRVWVMAYTRSAGWGTRDIRNERNDEQQAQSWGTTFVTKSSEAPAPMADTNSERLQEQRGAIPRIEKYAKLELSDWWRTEPNVGRVAHGVPSRVDRLKGLGNAIVPQISEIIGRAIMESEAS